jgi:hypothetical protein
MRKPICRREDSLDTQAEADRDGQGDPVQKRAAGQSFPL